MPLTRQQLRKINLSNSRILRSGGRLQAPSLHRRQVRRQDPVGQRGEPRSLSPVIPGHLDGPPASQPTHWPEAEGDALALDVLGGLQHLDPLEDDSQSVSDIRRSIATSPNSNIPPEPSLPVTAQNLLSNTVDPNNAGTPIDSTWDIVAAHEQRFCFDHGEIEWLIEYADRWMYPTDFDIDAAEVQLEARFEQYQRRLEDSAPYRYVSRAECSCRLWSQIDTPIQRNRAEDTVAFRIRWKLYWTPQSNVADLEFVRSSYNAQHKRLGRRRSVRVQDTAAARAAKIEEMRVVIDLEKWI